MNKVGKKKARTRFVLPEGQTKIMVEGQSPPQELEEGPRSKLYLLVSIII